MSKNTLTDEELSQVSGGTPQAYQDISEQIRHGQEEAAREQFKDYVNHGFLHPSEIVKLRDEFWLRFGYDIDS